MGGNFKDKALADNILKPLDDQVNRNAKDSVFCAICSPNRNTCFRCMPCFTLRTT